MKKAKILIIAIIALVFPLHQLSSAHYAGPRIGYILLQVEDNGEAWYVYPTTGKMYYLGRPLDALNLMKKLGLGAKHDFIANTNIFPDRLAGLILLDVEQNGEAYYIYPQDLKKYYLGRPADAFSIMRELGQGISNEGLANIPIGALNEEEVKIPLANKILLDVPFTSQAPFGQWEDKRQQDGCEESSTLMAVKWARGESLTKEEALDEILSASDFLLKKYGEFRDISSADTIEWLFKDYFNYPKAALKMNITIEDIISELQKGNLIITPMNGQIMHNPYYTSPGPPRHMVVIRGYDPAKQIFITNDPGTRNGKVFEYDVKVLYDAIRDYPTGYHEIITEIEKNMIVVWK
ncbi:MAG: C39 family peptidase [Patescibacteria group bacterium]